MTREQKASLIILLLVLILMFAAPYWAGDDSYLETAVITIFGGVSLFVIPKNRTEKFLNWSDVQKVPLGVLFILGAGLHVIGVYNIGPCLLSGDQIISIKYSALPSNSNSYCFYYDDYR